MKKGIKSLISVAISASMLLSLAGCADKANEQVVEAADSYAASLSKLEYKKLSKLVSEDIDKEDLEAFEMVCNYSDYMSDDAAAIVDAVKATITYEVDEESVDASTKDEEGEVDVVFTLADLEAVLKDEDNVADLDTLLDAIEDADTTEVTVTLPFVLEDEEWKVSDVEGSFDLFEDVFTAAEDVTFAVNYADYFTDYEWYGSDNGVYTDPWEIELWMYLSDEYYEDSPFDSYDFTYECVAPNGSTYTGWGCDAWIWASDLGMDEFEEGTYTITFFDPEGNEFYSDSCEVVITAEETTAAETEPAIDDDSIVLESGHVYRVDEDTDFCDNTDPTYTWFYAPDGSIAYSYASGETLLTMSAGLYSDSFDYDEEVYYYWSYSADNDDFLQGEYIAVGTATPYEFASTQMFYDFTLSVDDGDVDEIPDGHYWCEVWSADEEFMYLVGYITVGNV